MNSFYKNQYLFSEIYLKEITDFPEKPEITSTLNTLKEYKDYADTDSLNEWKSTFIQKVFGVLGFGYSSVDDNIIKLFRPGETESPISVCYALLPNENLDNDTIGSHWSEKIIRNLKANDLSWGLLTNGNIWRIYHVDEPSPYETYLQIDLSEILEKGDTKNYMIFFEFMKADNFIKGDEGKCKFDQFKEESFEKIEYIEEELKDALKQREGESGKGVLNDICMGYIEYLRSKGETDFSDEDFRKEIYSGAMLYMFRLLFIFYATARELLTQDEIDKFQRILKKSKNLFNTLNAKRDSNNLWEELRELFAIIEVHYNGGLFDPEEHKFIENTRISDYFLARVLYNMNFYKDDYGNEQLISYRDMGVRHLGTLYEGLLEHKLYVAEENTQVKIEKGAVKFIPKSQGGAIVEGNYIPNGDVYFAGDKGERKSTGSYYTPEYIVDYIVTNTVGEKLKEFKDEFVKENESLFDDINSAVDKAEKSRFINYLEEQLLSFTKKKTLKLSVLDPAMGSGHFLVNATNKIANFITEFLNEYELSSDQTSSTVYWRRRVVENCIYGVDINPLAVELAKLSLWILSMAKDAHLSFLNHHLKCGNSLIGARLSDIGIYPGNKKKEKKGELSLWDNDENFKQTVEKVINGYLAIEERETLGKNDIEFKKDLLDNINEDLTQYKKVCDLHTDIYFDETIDESYYFSKFKSPQTIEVENDSYFHWEIEYPEIFRERKGFDIIIANPPYLSYYGRFKVDMSKSEEIYYKDHFDFITNKIIDPKVIKGRFNAIMFFLELALKLGGESNYASLLVDLNIHKQPFYDIRHYLYKHARIVEVINDLKSFDNVGSGQSIIIYKKEIASDYSVSFKTKEIFSEKKMYLKSQLNFSFEPPVLDDSILLKIKRNMSGKLADFFPGSLIRTGIVFAGMKEEFLKIKKEENKRALLEGRKSIPFQYCEPIITNFINYDKEILNTVNKNYAEKLDKTKNKKQIWAGLGDSLVFELPKIIVVQTGKFICATYSEKDLCLNLSLFSISNRNSKDERSETNLKLILGQLNSKILSYFALKENYIQRKAGSVPQLRLKQLKMLPIILPDKEIEKIIVENVDKLLFDECSSDDNEFIKCASSIDTIMYDLYDLSNSEIDVVEEFFNDSANFD